MLPGRDHLVTVDLAFVDENDENVWPEDIVGEEYAYHIYLEEPERNAEHFTTWANEDATVRLHRQGSHGPAEFTVRLAPDCPPGTDSLGVMVVNDGGVPVGWHELQFTVADGADIPVASPGRKGCIPLLRLFGPRP